MPITLRQYAGMMVRQLARTPAEVQRVAALEHATQRESDLHDQIIKFCAEQPQPWVCLHSRTDRRATNNLGTPDFIIVTYTGAVWFIECKRKGSKLRPAQNAMLAWLRKNKANAGVVFSLDEFIELVK